MAKELPQVQALDSVSTHAQKNFLKKSFGVRTYGLGQLIIVLPISDGQFADLYRGDKNNAHSWAWWHTPLVLTEKEISVSSRPGPSIE